MRQRLKIPFDILSDENLLFTNNLKLPIFEIEKKKFIKRLTMIVEKSVIKKVFYPIYPVEKHVDDVLKWLANN